MCATMANQKVGSKDMERRRVLEAQTCRVLQLIGGGQEGAVAEVVLDKVRYRAWLPPGCLLTSSLISGLTLHQSRPKLNETLNVDLMQLDKGPHQTSWSSLIAWRGEHKPPTRSGVVENVTGVVWSVQQSGGWLLAFILAGSRELCYLANEGAVGPGGDPVPLELTLGQLVFFSAEPKRGKRSRWLTKSVCVVGDISDDCSEEPVESTEPVQPEPSAAPVQIAPSTVPVQTVPSTAPVPTAPSTAPKRTTHILLTDQLGRVITVHAFRAVLTFISPPPLPPSSDASTTPAAVGDSYKRVLLSIQRFQFSESSRHAERHSLDSVLRVGDTILFTCHAYARPESQDRCYWFATKARCVSASLATTLSSSNPAGAVSSDNRRLRDRIGVITQLWPDRGMIRFALQSQRCSATFSSSVVYIDGSPVTGDLDKSLSLNLRVNFEAVYSSAAPSQGAGSWVCTCLWRGDRAPACITSPAASHREPTATLTAPTQQQKPVAAARTAQASTVAVPAESGDSFTMAQISELLQMYMPSEHGVAAPSGCGGSYYDDCQSDGVWRSIDTSDDDDDGDDDGERLRRRQQRECLLQMESVTWVGDYVEPDVEVSLDSIVEDIQRRIAGQVSRSVALQSAVDGLGSVGSKVAGSNLHSDVTSSADCVSNGESPSAKSEFKLDNDNIEIDLDAIVIPETTPVLDTDLDPKPCLNNIGVNSEHQEKVLSSHVTDSSILPEIQSAEADVGYASDDALVPDKSSTVLIQSTPISEDTVPCVSDNAQAPNRDVTDIPDLALTPDDGIPDAAQVCDGFTDSVQVCDDTVCGITDSDKVFDGISESSQVCGNSPEPSPICEDVPDLAQICEDIPDPTQICGDIPDSTQVIGGEFPASAHILDNALQEVTDIAITDISHEVRSMDNFRTDAQNSGDADTSQLDDARELSGSLSQNRLAISEMADLICESNSQESVGSDTGRVLSEEASLNLPEKVLGSTSSSEVSATDVVASGCKVSVECPGADGVSLQQSSPSCDLGSSGDDAVIATSLVMSESCSLPPVDNADVASSSPDSPSSSIVPPGSSMLVESSHHTCADNVERTVSKPDSLESESHCKRSEVDSYPAGSADCLIESDSCENSPDSKYADALSTIQEVSSVSGDSIRDCVSESASLGTQSVSNCGDIGTISVSSFNNTAPVPSMCHDVPVSSLTSTVPSDNLSATNSVPRTSTTNSSRNNSALPQDNSIVFAQLDGQCLVPPVVSPHTVTTVSLSDGSHVTTRSLDSNSLPVSSSIDLTLSLQSVLSRHSSTCGTMKGDTVVGSSGDFSLSETVTPAIGVDVWPCSDSQRSLVSDRDGGNIPGDSRAVQASSAGNAVAPLIPAALRFPRVTVTGSMSAGSLPVRATRFPVPVRPLSQPRPMAPTSPSTAIDKPPGITRPLNPTAITRPLNPPGITRPLNPPSLTRLHNHTALNPKVFTRPAIPSAPTMPVLPRPVHPPGLPRVVTAPGLPSRDGTASAITQTPSSCVFRDSGPIYTVPECADTSSRLKYTSGPSEPTVSDSNNNKNNNHILVKGAGRIVAILDDSFGVAEWKQTQQHVVFQRESCDISDVAMQTSHRIFPELLSEGQDVMLECVPVQGEPFQWRAVHIRINCRETPDRPANPVPTKLPIA